VSGPHRGPIQAEEAAALEDAIEDGPGRDRRRGGPRPRHWGGVLV